jgi:hypothetical protein
MRRRLFELSAFGFGHTQSVREGRDRIAVRRATQALFEGPNCSGTQAGAFRQVFLRVSGSPPLLTEKFRKWGLARHDDDFAGRRMGPRPPVSPRSSSLRAETFAGDLDLRDRPLAVDGLQ